MAMQTTLEMTFGTELGSSHRISVYDASETVTAEEVSLVMDNIIAANIFSGSGGALISKSGARLVVRDVSEIDLV